MELETWQVTCTQCGARFGIDKMFIRLQMLPSRFAFEVADLCSLDCVIAYCSVLKLAV